MPRIRPCADADVDDVLDVWYAASLVRSFRPVLELSVFAANTRARRFYEAYGFVVVGRQISDVEGQPELRLLLADSETLTSQPSA